jgi:hypothetical protein
MTYICESVAGCGGPAMASSAWPGLDFMFICVGISILTATAIAVYREIKE